MAAVFMLCEIDDFADRPADAVEDIHAPLGASVLGFHWIQHHPAVCMKTDPVVRKDRIRRMRLRYVLSHDDLDVVGTQLPYQRIEFEQRRGLLGFRRCI